MKLKRAEVKMIVKAVLVVLGLFIVVGTVGSSDLDMTTLAGLAIKGGIGLSLVGAGTYL